MEWLSSIEWIDVGLWLVAVALMLVGIAGTVVPALPGIPMVFIGIWIVAWIDDYALIGWVPLVVCGVLTVIGFAVDWVAQTLGAQRAGASKWGIYGSLVGTVLGLFMGIFGILFMPLIGAFVGEYLYQKDLKIARNVGWATWVGMMAGSAIKIAISFMMIGIMCLSLWV